MKFSSLCLYANHSFCFQFSELVPMMNLLCVSESHQFNLFMLVDKDSSGQIDFGEFIELIHLVGSTYSHNLLDVETGLIMEPLEKPSAASAAHDGALKSRHHSAQVFPVGSASNILDVQHQHHHDHHLHPPPATIDETSEYYLNLVSPVTESEKEKNSEKRSCDYLDFVSPLSESNNNVNDFA